MRDLKNLYEIFFEYYVNAERRTKYICNMIAICHNNGIINVEEKDLLLNHFRTQYPTAELHPEFYKSEYFICHGTGIAFAWFGGATEQVSIAIRIKFLNKIISTL